MYNLEADSTLKQAYRLTIKALHPHSVERQNVRLALRIFDDYTAIALLILGPKHTDLVNWLGTSKFISTIIKLWDMLNVKSYNCAKKMLMSLTVFLMTEWNERRDLLSG